MGMAKRGLDKNRELPGVQKKSMDAAIFLSRRPSSGHKEDSPLK